MRGEERGEEECFAAILMQFMSATYPVPADLTGPRTWKAAWGVTIVTGGRWEMTSRLELPKARLRWVSEHVCLSVCMVTS